ncbi:50S ribosomal protein L1-like [Mercenaria mercenaria]|uniref:50S ribosomal protein L1-like n=1 Tax=Mercenaria mercenaria TaxID=6596 RepID=UPI00234EF24F|nr:50S ribosomal protein L1-like [Mercenaria mercenaria]
MAASMFRKGLYRARSFCVIKHELESVFSLQRQQCRLRKTAAVSKKSKRDEPVVPVKKFLRQTPIHSIYIMEDYPVQKFGFEECVEMHKEAAQPKMTNTLHAQIYADIQLNMNTNKKTKFMRNIRGLLEFPHKFDHQQKKDIFVFSENPLDWERCKELGATTVGGEEIIGYISQGIISKSDIEKCDFMFATPAIAAKLLKQRGLLMDKTPTLTNGCIVSEFEPVLKKYMEGVKYKSHKESDSIGRVQIPFGQLNQETEELEENFTYMLSVLSGLKPKNQAALLQTMRLIAPPSTEIFELDLETYRQRLVESQSKTEEDSDEDD